MRVVYGVVLGLGLMAVAAEVGARSLGFGHPLLYKPSAAGYEIASGQTVNRLGKTTHINALGTRGPETTPLPAPSMVRILALGDSVANGGAQINDDQTWPLQLQTDLVRSGKQIEVLNAAAGGWAVQNEAAWLQEHGALGAKLIILAVNEKDLDQPFAGPELLDTNASFPSKAPATGLGEVFGRYLLPRLGLTAPAVDPGSTAASFHAENAPAVLGAVESIRRLASANGAKLLILYWDLRTPASAAASQARDRLYAYAAANGVEVIRPNLNRDRNGAALFRDDIHPNAAGNAVVAQRLSAQLEARLDPQRRQVDNDGPAHFDVAGS